jgi:acetoin utilization deacetylase AcuC-like enzyme
MKVVYSPRYRFDLGAHVFPTIKYHLVHARLRAAGLVSAEPVVEPEPASWDQLARVHERAFLEKARTGFSWAEQAQMELPWSEAITEGFRLMCGGTVTAARLAASEVGHAVAVHVGGGFHHAFADHGEGFCLFNDVAIAVRALQAERLARRVAILDLDVHHGNGTAAIFRDDDEVFTCSMHQERNYPAEKPPGSLDVGLADRTGDTEYLAHLADVLPRLFAARPDIVFYLAGADPFEDDKLGGLALSKSGLRERDRAVFASAAAAGCPVVVTLAGGYARNVNDTVDIHVATVEEAFRSQ